MGETEKGISIKLVNKLLPVNSNLAITQEAATPNTKLSGTAKRIVINVS